MAKPLEDSAEKYIHNLEVIKTYEEVNEERIGKLIAFFGTLWKRPRLCSALIKRWPDFVHPQVVSFSLVTDAY